MKTLTKSEIKALRDQIDAALLPILKANGLSNLTAGNASFNPDKGTFTFKLNGTIEDAPAPVSAADAARADYIRVYELFGLPVIDSKVTLRNRKGLPEVFTIAGLSPTGKNIHITKGGKTFAAPLNIVIKAFEQARKS